MDARPYFSENIMKHKPPLLSTPATGPQAALRPTFGPTLAATLALTLALAGAAAAAPPSDTPADYAYGLPLSVSGNAGVVAFRLPREVYLHAASAELNDLRLFDRQGNKL
ncbi:MAG TPA: hypothetical protein DCW29_04905, partial [Janthinobacterium sp.]|nr:hypothetical protein [Janthinobacterium sp.]